jgi:DNA-binding MarR family transcriptional regulator
MTFADSHEIAMALRAAYLALHRQTDAVLVRWDVTADQFVVLFALSRGDALTQRELVERTSSDPSTIGAMLLRLEGKGLVERLPNPRDARARTVRLTRNGRAAFRRMWSGTEPLRQRLSILLGPAAMGPLVSALQAVAVGLEEDTEERSSRAGGASLRSGRRR